MVVYHTPENVVAPLCTLDQRFCAHVSNLHMGTWFSKIKRSESASRRDGEAVEAIYEGTLCREDLSKIDGRPHQGTCALADCDISFEQYNTSDVVEFAKLMRGEDTSVGDISIVFKDVNFIACHGRFIRELIKHIDSNNTELHRRLNDQKDKNLFIVKVGANHKTFYLIRHCARQYQGKWQSRITPDPVCVRTEDGSICDEAPFRAQIQFLCSKHQGTAMGVFSSCLRRASETAAVVLDEVRRSHVPDPPDQVLILPFCREHLNHLRNMDVLNNCKYRQELSTNCEG